MRKILLSCLALAALLTQANAQTPTKWIYNFGNTNVGTYTGGVTSSSSFPATQTVNTYTGGGIAVAGPGTDGGVGIVTSGGTGIGGRLKLSVPSADAGSGTTNKFSIFDTDANSATRQGAIKFTTSFEGGGGDVVLSVGNGVSYSNSTNISASSSMALVRFNFNAAAADVSVQLYAKTLANWTGALSTTYAKNVEHTVEVYYNNLNVVGTYAKGGSTTNSLAKNTFDLWIDDLLVADDAEISGTMSINLANEASKIDSYMFSNRTMSNGGAIWYVDNVAYTNFLPTDESVLPVAFTQVSAKSIGTNVQVNWTTASEANNHHFEIEASTDGKTFKKLKTVQSKNGNSSQVQEYQETITLTDIATVLAFPLLLGFIGFGQISRRRKIAFSLIGIFALATCFVACQKEASGLLSQKDQDRTGIISGQKNIYIRIKQVDNDGKFNYSDVVLAK